MVKMCSLNDEREEIMETVSASRFGLGTTCKKCKEKTAEVVLRVKDAYCRECFLQSFTHKFRALLGKSRLVKPKENVLVGFSGSQSSVALLHLIHQGIHESSHKRLLFHPTVVYIDEGALLGQSKDERQVIHTSVAKVIEKYGFPAFVITLDRSLENDASIGSSLSELKVDCSLDIRDCDDEKLKAFIDGAKSLTSKEDLIQILRKNLLLAVANALKCSKIFVADVETDLAILLLSNISLGRGAQLPLDVGFCDSRNPEIPILRPMRDYMKKEVVFFNFFMKLESIFIPALSTRSDYHDSIQKLTEKFITQLESDFPGTVSTVFRTGEKLNLANTCQNAEELCALCHAPLDTKSLENSAAHATEFSSIVSTLGPAGFDDKYLEKSSENIGRNKVLQHSAPNREVCESSSGYLCKEEAQTEDLCGCSTTSSWHNKKVTWAETEEFLCYGCKRISKEMDERSCQLPKSVIERVNEQSNYKEMREEIKDFLL